MAFVNATAGIDTFDGTGDGSTNNTTPDNDTNAVNLNGDAATGDAFDGGGGTDSIELGSNGYYYWNDISLANIENLIGSGGGEEIEMTSAQFDMFEFVDMVHLFNSLIVHTSADYDFSGAPTQVLNTDVRIEDDNNGHYISTTQPSFNASVNGNGGDDTIEAAGGAAGTTLNGGAGNDLLIYDGSGQPGFTYVFDYLNQSGLEQNVGDGASIQGFERFQIGGSESNDVLDLEGAADANGSSLTGNGGDDQVRVDATTGGTITFSGDGGNDRLVADFTTSAAYAESFGSHLFLTSQSLSISAVSRSYTSPPVRGATISMAPRARIRLTAEAATTISARPAPKPATIRSGVVRATIP